jgi:GTPase
MSPDVKNLPVVAVVGRPNVGKSSLVNRVLGRREAIVEAVPGVTRDRHGYVAEWSGRHFELVDTGGLEPGARGLEQSAAEQAEVALETADVVVLVVDAQAGPLQDDMIVAERLRRARKPVVVAVNKVDDGRDSPLAAAFFRLGLGDPYPVSALHGTGSGDLLEAVVGLLPATGRRDDSWASLAIVGRPNVGKSSLLNSLVGDARSIVDSTPGTTRDPVDSIIELDGGRRLRLVDTAGMRRQVRIDDPIEYFSWLRARRTLERADVAALVVDGEAGPTTHDQHIAEAIVQKGRACVLVINKWDLVRGEDADPRLLERDIKDRMRFISWAPVVRTAALTGRGVDRIIPTVEGAVEAHRRRLPTAQVNRLIQAAQEARPHPRIRGRAIRVLYSVQAAVAPPTFVLFTNGSLEPSYLRFLENRLRAADPFTGTTIRLRYRIKTRREVEA